MPRAALRLRYDKERKLGFIAIDYLPDTGPEKTLYVKVVAAEKKLTGSTGWDGSWLECDRLELREEDAKKFGYPVMALLTSSIPEKVVTNS